MVRKGVMMGVAIRSWFVTKLWSRISQTAKMLIVGKELVRGRKIGVLALRARRVDLAVDLALIWRQRDASQQ